MNTKYMYSTFPLHYRDTPMHTEMPRIFWLKYLTKNLKKKLMKGRNW